MKTEILLLARNVRREMSGGTQGKCLDHSRALQNLLKSEGYTCGIQIGLFNSQPHAWLDVWLDAGLWWLDITADQFGDYPEIIFCPAFSRHEYSWESPP